MFTTRQRQFISQESFRRKEETSAISHRNHLMAMASAPPSESKWDLDPKAPPPSASPPPPPPPGGSATPVVTATPVYDTNIQYNNINTSGKNTNNNNNKSYQIMGKNKKLRDRAKYILAATCVLLFLNQNGWALVCSVLALFTLKRGTLWSHKNWKWLLLAAISVGVSAAGFLWNRSEQKIDQRRAYHMKMGLWIVANWLSGFWAIVLGLFLVSALYRPEQLDHYIERAADHVPPIMGRPAVTGLAPAVPDWSYHHAKQQ